MNGGNGGTNFATVAPGSRQQRTPPPNPADKIGAPKAKAPLPTMAGCEDLSDQKFHDAMHTSVLETHWHATKYTKTCKHAMFMNLCGDEKIGSSVSKMCCKSCKSDDGKVCVNKPAAEVSKIVGKEKVSCGTLVASNKAACDNAKIKGACCAECRWKAAHPKCNDVTETQLKALLGATLGEGGCGEAAAHGRCEKDAKVHAACCASCDLHRDITV